MMHVQSEAGIADDHVRGLLDELQAIRKAGPSSASSPQDWAHSICAVTRDIHFEIWDTRPSHVLVEHSVIEEFTEAGKDVRAIPEAPRHPTRKYARNIAARILNLWHYVRDEESQFAPAEREPADQMVAEWEQMSGTGKTLLSPR